MKPEPRLVPLPVPTRTVTTLGSTFLTAAASESGGRCAALADGTADRHCVFEVFARRLPTGRRYGVVAGTGRLIELIQDFRFHDAELDYLRGQRIVDDATAQWLAGLEVHRGVSRDPAGQPVLPRS